MKKFAILLVLLVLAGCNRGDFKASTVFEGQVAPHDGWNFGPETYVLQGQPVKVSGLLIYVKGLDPNNVLGE
jgi:hypothetical protein